MSETNAASSGPDLRQALGLDRHPLTPAKVAALVAAIVMMGLGAVLSIWGPAETGPGSVASAEAVTAREGAGDGGAGLMGSGFAESRPAPDNPTATPAPGAASEPAPPKDDGWSARDVSPFLLKGGFGLFLGFAIGYAIRAFLRLAVLVAGFYFLLLAMMAYAGWVEVRWDVMGEQFGNLASAAAAQFSSFKAFLTGAIPATGLTAAGLALGLRRK